MPRTRQPWSGPAPARSGSTCRAATGDDPDGEAPLTARKIVLRAGIPVAALASLTLLTGAGLADGSADSSAKEKAALEQRAHEAGKLRAQIRRERAVHARQLAATVRRERAKRRAAVRRVLRSSGATGNVDHAIEVAAATYGVSEARLRSVARCESGFNPGASNGQYLGLFQFGTPLWSTTPVARFSRTDPYAAALGAAWAFSRGMSGHWACA